MTSFTFPKLAFAGSMVCALATNNSISIPFYLCWFAFQIHLFHFPSVLIRAIRGKKRLCSFVSFVVNQNPSSFKFCSLLFLTFSPNNSFQNSSSYLRDSPSGRQRQGHPDRETRDSFVSNSLDPFHLEWFQRINQSHIRRPKINIHPFG